LEVTRSTGTKETVRFFLGSIQKVLIIDKGTSMKTFTFHILRTFRWLVIPILKLLSGLSCVFFLIATFTEETKLSVAITFLIFSILLGSLSWYYDSLIKKLSPEIQTNQPWN
jgi:hypothetical protein